MKKLNISYIKKKKKNSDDDDKYMLYKMIQMTVYPQKRH